MAPVPADVRRYLAEAVPSVPYLEAALWFHREGRRPRSICELASALYVSHDVGASLIEALVANGIVASDETHYRYAPASAELSELLDRLADVYSRELVEVTKLLHEKPGRNPRRFSEALRRKQKGD